MTLIRVTAPTDRPVTLADLKDAMRWDGDHLDAHMDECLAAATARFEGPNGLLGRALVTQTWRLVLDSFPAVIRIPLPPVQSVTSIVYLDSAGDEQTLDPSAYRVTGETVSPLSSWPATAELAGAVTVTFVAGYGDPSAVPEDVRAAIRGAAADMIDHDNGHEAGVSEFVARHREWVF